MKRTISLILAVILICFAVPCTFADSNEFDYQSVLGGRDGYEYDKFDKSWSYYRAYAKRFSDAAIVVGLRVESESGQKAPSLTSLYVKIMNNNGSKLYDVTSIDFLIGDDLYSYESMLAMDTSSSVIIAQNGLLLFQAIRDSNASDVAIRIGTKERGNFTLDNLDTVEWNYLKEFCQVYLECNIWDYFVDKDTPTLYESYFPLTINGEPADYESAVKSF